MHVLFDWDNDDGYFCRSRQAGKILNHLSERMLRYVNLLVVLFQVILPHYNKLTSFIAADSYWKAIIILSLRYLIQQLLQLHSGYRIKSSNLNWTSVVSGRSFRQIDSALPVFIDSLILQYGCVILQLELLLHSSIENEETNLPHAISHLTFKAVCGNEKKVAFMNCSMKITDFLFIFFLKFAKVRKNGHICHYQTKQFMF